MQLMVNSSLDPAYNLALEELLTRNTSGNVFLLWRNSASVIIGRNQNLRSEVNLDLVNQMQIPVIRRNTGGGAVYHDPGNINYSVFVPANEIAPNELATFVKPIQKILQNWNIPVEISGRNDLTVHGKKISGSARTILGNRELFHGTLLFETDMEILNRILTPDPEKIAAKGIHSVKSRVGNLKELLPNSRNAKHFLEELTESLLQYFDQESVTDIPKNLVLQAEHLAQHKYRSWEWNVGQTPNFEISRSKRFAGGRLEIHMNIHRGKIEQIHFSGDFIGIRPAEELAQFLRNTPLKPDDLKEKLRNCNDYFADITRSELLELFF